MARIDAAEDSIVVARSLIEEGRVDLVVPRLAPVRVAVGQRLVLAHVYDLVEASPKHETFGFGIAATTPGEPPKKGRSIVQDRPMVHDDIKGAVSVAYRFAEPGRRTVRLTFWTEYRIGAWARAPATGERREASGSLTVVVEGPTKAAPARPAKKAAKAKPAKTTRKAARKPARTTSRKRT